MGKYEKLAKNIVKNVGGKGNINAVMHCVTRLRFKLKDESKANDDVIKNMDGVVTLIKSGGQYQIVIGNHVPDVYTDVCAVANIAIGSANTQAEKEKRSLGASILDYVTAIFNPTLSVLCASGILKGILTLLTLVGILDEADTLYLLLKAAGDALFYFFPVFLGYNTAAKVGMNQLLGAALGAALMYPEIQGMEEAAVLGLDVSGISYTSTVIPIILLIIVAAPVERWLRKVIPDVIKTFVVPLVVLMIFVPLGYCVIGPAANAIADVITAAISGVYNISPALCGIILGGLWQVLVVFGIHTGLAMLMIVDLVAGNPSPMMALIGAPGFAQTAVVFAIWLKTKDKKLKNIAFPAWISGIFGVTEPAIYGVTLPRFKYFVISCIGAAAGGLYAGLTNVKVYQMAGMGIFSLPGLLTSEGTGNLVNGIIARVIAIIVAGVITFVIYKDNHEKQLENSVKRNARKIISPIAGKIVPLSQVEDAAFAENLLGKGIAVEPSIGKVMAPANGVLTTLFPTNHALGITAEDGAEILIHIGMDTVQLEGKYFYPKAKQGDSVKQGQVLMEFDIEAIKNAGFSVITPVIITNTNEFSDVVETDIDAVTTSDVLLYCLNR